ncbi:MAG: sugar transferase [Myxococcota bacterium]
MDVAIAGVALAATAPVIAAAAGGILVTMGRPVFFKQLRAGYKEKPFTLYKFRTMREAFDEAGRPLDDGKRLTKLGNLLRITSIDELPQLINVIKGDMSIVGPRPLLYEYVSRYTPEKRRRHDMPPGITGLTQVEGRAGQTWEERFKKDLEYVDNWSLWLDIKIILKTPFVVMSMKDINLPGHSTNPLYEETVEKDKDE